MLWGRSLVEVQYVPGEFEVYIPQIDDSMTIGLDINFENDEWIYHNASFKAKGKYYIRQAHVSLLNL